MRYYEPGSEDEPMSREQLILLVKKLRQIIRQQEQTIDSFEKDLAGLLYGRCPDEDCHAKCPKRDMCDQKDFVECWTRYLEDAGYEIERRKPF